MIGREPPEKTPDHGGSDRETGSRANADRQTLYTATRDIKQYTAVALSGVVAPLEPFGAVRVGPISGDLRPFLVGRSRDTRLPTRRR